MSIHIYYDGDCPVCSRYVRLLRLRDAAGPIAWVTYQRNNLPEVTRSAQEILALDGGQLHPVWVRKYFHFRPVFLESPRSCY